LDNWSNVELLFCLRLHIIPSELDKLEFWRIEALLDKYDEYVKKENEETSHQQKEYETKYKASTPKMPDYKIPSMPNMNNFGGFKIPKM
jgi:hypothetical protein